MSDLVRDVRVVEERPRAYPVARRLGALAFVVGAGALVATFTAGYARGARVEHVFFVVVGGIAMRVAFLPPRRRVRVGRARFARTGIGFAGELVLATSDIARATASASGIHLEHRDRGRWMQCSAGSLEEARSMLAALGVDERFATRVYRNIGIDGWSKAWRVAQIALVFAGFSAAAMDALAGWGFVIALAALAAAVLWGRAMRALTCAIDGDTIVLEGLGTRRVIEARTVDDVIDRGNHVELVLDDERSVRLFLFEDSEPGRRALASQLRRVVLAS